MVARPTIWGRGAQSERAKSQARKTPARSGALLGDRIERYMRSREEYRPKRPPMPAYARPFLLCSLLALASCGEAPKQSAAPPAPAELVAKPTQRNNLNQSGYVRPST